MRAPIVPIRPAFRPSASRIDSSRYVVVVLPFVRVIEEVGRDQGRRPARIADEHLGHAGAGRPLDAERHRAGLDGSRGEAVAVHPVALDAEEEVAGGHPRRVIRDVLHRSARVAAQLQQEISRRAGELAKPLHL
jgi:hypothetical protein